MKKLLLVEDDPNKLKQIEVFFESSKDLLPSLSLTTRMSFSSGLREVLSKKYDLILLDMSMHNFDKTETEDGGEFMQFAGEDILREMLWSEINSKVIVVTQYDLIGTKTLNELKLSWASEFSDNYIDSVYYSSDESKWQSDLINLINENLK